jgi:glycine betaine/choline ABC-type transport system substrate-binding protein
MTKKLAVLLSGSVLLTALAASPGYSCVGRILNFSIDGSPEQKAAGQLMATYINERTGTTVNLVENPPTEDGSCPADTDICIQYLKPALERMGGEQPQDEKEAYSRAKEYYLENKQMVWLRPFSFKGPAQADSSMAVPVSPRSSLTKFPVLDRVINKLSGMITDDALHEMMNKLQGSSDPVVAAKEFLKSRKLI